MITVNSTAMAKEHARLLVSARESPGNPNLTKIIHLMKAILRVNVLRMQPEAITLLEIIFVMGAELVQALARA